MTDTDKAQTTLTHVDASGQANMVDVTEKAVTQREARAQGYIYMSEQALALVVDNAHKKGDVLAIARIAGIQGAKLTSQLIPLCHPLMLTKVQIDFHVESDRGRIQIQSLCKLSGQTGVEMEALTAVNVAALTVYDMCKAVDKHMHIEGVQVLAKSGGKSGSWEI